MKIFLIGLSVAITDQFSKWLVRKKIPFNQRIPIFKGKGYLTNVRNYGAVYGTFEQRPRLLMFLTLFSLAHIGKVFHQRCREEKNAGWYRLSMAFIFGGAGGNVISRAVLGYVTDFICVRKGKNAPIFNIADFFILLGGVFFLLCEFGRDRRTKK